MNNPKFEKKVTQNIVKPAMYKSQQATTGYAIVLSYSAEANTACIQMSHPNSNVLGQIYQNVVCPTTIGVQGVSPGVGRPCTVIFKGGGNGSDYFPIITSFFNHAYYSIDHPSQSTSVNNIPRFITGNS